MERPEGALFRASALPTVVVGTVVGTIASLHAGFDGALGAAFGTVLVVVFFGIGLAVSRRAARIAPELVMGLAMLTYVVKVLGLGAVLLAFRGTEAFDTRAFAAAVLVGTIVWLGAQVRAFTRVPILYVDPDAGGR